MIIGAVLCGLVVLCLVVFAAARIFRKVDSRAQIKKEDDEKYGIVSDSFKGVVKVRNCGHEGPDRFEINVYGVKGQTNLEGISEDKNLCPECFWQKFKTRLDADCARCCLCGQLIAPGEAVALYHKSDKGVRYKEVAKQVGDDFVGCMGWDCCPSGGFHAGHWSKDGFKPLFEGGMSVAMACLTSGKIVAGNTDDPSSVKFTNVPGHDYGDEE